MDHAQASYLGQLVLQIGPSRLAPYLRAASGDNGIAVARYYWNAELCRAYYPMLQAVEVALRNKLDRAIALKYPTSGKYDHINSWIDRTSRVAVHPNAEASIQEAKSKLIKDPSTHLLRRDYRDHNDLVAAMSFGFWVALLETAYDDPGTNRICFWNPATATDPNSFERRVFPNAKGELMSSIRATFNQLRHFRNRVFHHEPVWPKHPSQPTPKERYDAICKALRWLGGEQSQLPPVLHKTPDIFDDAEQVPAMRERLHESIATLLERAQRKQDGKKNGESAASSADQ